MIPHSRPKFNRADQRAVKEALRSGHASEGPRVAKAETELAVRIKAASAAAVCSGTKALELSIRALGIGAGDEVIAPSFCCSSVYHAVAATGAVCTLADIEPETYHLSPESVENRRTRRTKAVILVHTFGLPDDPAPFKRMGLKIVEDCAPAIGARLGSRPVGSLGDISIFSFYSTKLIACGEGGMVASRDRKLVDRVKDIRECDNVAVDHLRQNVKWTDLQAALFSSQLKRLGRTLAERDRIARYYDLRLDAVGADAPAKLSGRVYWRYVVRGHKTAEELIRRFASKGIAARRPVFRPLHWDIGPKKGFECTEDAWHHCVSLPLYPSLLRAERRRIADAAAALLAA